MDEQLMVLLRNQKLLKGLTDDELVKVSALLKRRTFERADSVILEDEHSSDIFLIASGEVKILKWDEDHLFQLPVGKLKAGEMFGEMSFMDYSARSSTIEALDTLVTYQLSREDIESRLPDMALILEKIISNIAIINFERLRAANTAHVKTLRSSLKQLRERLLSSLMTVYTLIGFGFINVLFYFYNLSPLLYWPLLTVPVYLILKKFHQYVDQFGVRKKHIGKTLLESAGFAALAAIAMFLIYAAIPSLQSQKLPPLLWLGLIIYVPAYEFIARGIIQNLVRRFLTIEDTLKTVLIASIIATILPLVSYYHERWVHVLAVLLINLGLGFIFSRQKNLAGVIIIHFVISFLGLYLFESYL
jgi:CRP-like cAMP-binding protein